MASRGPGRTGETFTRIGHAPPPSTAQAPARHNTNSGVFRSSRAVARSTHYRNRASFTNGDHLSDASKRGIAGSESLS